MSILDWSMLARLLHLRFCSLRLFDLRSFAGQLLPVVVLLFAAAAPLAPRGPAQGQIQQALEELPPPIQEQVDQLQVPSGPVGQVRPRQKEAGKAGSVDSDLFAPFGAELAPVDAGDSDVGDVNGDGIPDILLTGFAQSGSIITRLYLGNGDGTFTEAGAGLRGTFFGSADIVDADSDGNPDLLVTGYDSTDAVTATLYLGDGNGNFTEAGASLTEVGFSTASIADVNGDSNPDILIAGANSSSLPVTTLHLGNGDGTFTEAEAGLSGRFFSASATADFNGDSNLDLLLTGQNLQGTDTTTVYLGDGQGGFSGGGADLPGTASGSVSVDDVNGDANPDVLLTNATGDRPTVLYLGDGGGGFTRAGAGLIGVGGGSSSIADINGDANPDLLLTGADQNDTLRTALYFGDGAGGFSEAGADLKGVWFSSSSVGDIEGDGDMDLLITGEDSEGTPSTTLYQNLEAEENLAIGSAPEYAQDLELSWNDVGAGVTYRVELATARDSSAVVQAFDAGTSTSYTVDGSSLEEGQAYYARVLASDDGGATFEYRSGFTAGTVIDRTPPVVNRPVGTLTDQADVSFSVTGSDNTRIDSFDVQISDDEAFGSVLKEKTLAPSGSVLYDGTRGTTYYARARAQDAAGLESNYTGASVGVAIPELPDLAVSGVSGPGEAFSGQEIEVTWTVSNEGSVGTNEPTWQDDIYLSEDESFDPRRDTRLGRAENVSFLDASEQYAGQTTVTLPQGTEGDFHLFVQADGGEKMAEAGESNNASGTPLSVELSPYPDLEVTDLQVPATAFSGNTIQVSWTVTNNGTGPADLEEWTDSVFLSADSTLEFNFTPSEEEIRINEDLLGTVSAEGPLPVDSSYTASAQVPLPPGETDDIYVFAYADIPGGDKQPRNGTVYEYNQDLDNWRGAPVDINLTPPPDLAVTSVEGPSEATSGEDAQVTWTVENQGPGPVPARSDSWNEAIYYVPSATFDSSEAELLRVTSRSGTLKSDSSYSQSATVTVPDGAEGTGYFFVETDWNDEVFEHTFEDNNRGGPSGGTAVELAPYPDLQATGLTLPGGTSATAGQQVEVRYVSENAGSVQAQGWTDSLYVSPSSSWDRSEARPLEAVSVSSLLEAGQSREQVAAATLPPGLEAGTYYVWAVADAGEEAFELPDTTANQARSGALSVEGYPPIDLAAEIGGVPQTVSSGAGLEPTITIRNEGSGATLSNTWIDKLYVSKDSILDDRDRQLAALTREARLEGGASYALSPSLSVPNELEGSYYLLAVADEGSRVSDTDRQNNVAARPVTIERPAPSDLVVTSLQADSAAESGQPLTVRWEIQNQGSGATRDSLWYDAIYLSRDPSVSEGDVRLGTAERSGALGAGETYADSITTGAPPFAAGTYYVLVETDRRGDVYEHQAESNNVSSALTDLTLPPKSDLVVESVEVPDSAVAGREVTVSWTTKNNGPNPAEGTIREGVFLSDDESWDLEDPFLGSIERSVSLGAGEEAQAATGVNLSKAYKAGKDGVITGPLPGVEPGDYHVIVRTDLAGSIRETDDDNNLRSSDTQTDAQVPSLALGDSTSLSLGESESQYYRVEVPAGGKDLSFDLSTDESVTSLKLYLRRGEVPTPNEFDQGSTAPFEASQSITVSDAEAGTYFLLAETGTSEGTAAGKAPRGGASSETASVQASLSAEELTFSVEKLAPTRGGNGGVVTVSVEGARFEEGARLFLQDDGGAQMVAQETNVGSSTRLKARLNLRDQAVGTYDVVVQNPSDSSEAVMADAFTVEDSEGADPYVETQYPTAIRSESDFSVKVTVGNRGNENAVDLFLLLGVRGYQGQLESGSFVTVQTSGAAVPKATGPKAKGGPGPFAQDPSPAPVKVTDTYPYSELDLEQDITVADTTSLGITTDQETVISPFWFYEIPPGQELTFQLELSPEISEGVVLHTGEFVEMPSSQFKKTASPADIETSKGVQLMAEALGETIEQLGSAQAQKIAKQDQTPTADEAESRLRDLAQQVATSVSDLGTGAAVGTSLGFAAGAAAFCLATAGSCAVGGAILAGFTGAGTGGFLGGVYDVMSGSEKAVKEGEDLIDDTFDGVDGNSTTVQSSFDPNDIIGPDSYGEKGWVATDQSLGYKIRFENDPERATAPAQVVEIRHPLDADIDERAFELGSFGFANQTFEVPDGRASYSTRLDVTDSLGVFVDVTAGLDVESREAFWRFTTIDPTTGSQPTSDPTAGFLPINDSTGRGEGFVRYQVQPDKSAPTGTEIEAEADIVFDRNAPIETPVVVNTVDADDPSSALDVVPAESKDETFKLSWTGSDAGAGVDRFQLYVAEGESGRFEPYESSTQDTSLVFVGKKNETYRFQVRATDRVGNREPAKASGDTTRTLPVELAGFEATLESGDALLQWTTASETKNAGFHVERSVDGGPFEEIGFVDGAGTVSSAEDYSYRDAGLPFEAEQITYRLRQVDLDGTATRTDPVTIERTSPEQFALHPNYPNPPSSQTTIPYEVAQSSEVRARLYDVLGREVMDAPLGQREAGRYEHRLDVSRLASGTYFLELRAERDGRTLFREVQKITVVR